VADRRPLLGQVAPERRRLERPPPPHGGGFLIVCREDPSGVLDAAARAFLDELGCRWIVVGDGRPAAPNAVQEIDGDQLRFLRKHGFAAYLRRPDFLLFGGVSELSQLPGLIDDLRRKLRWAATEPAGADGKAQEPAK
jgi:3-(3-hydroxy-phenyl)propionate hydroxylase